MHIACIVYLVIVCDFFGSIWSLDHGVLRTLDSIDSVHTLSNNFLFPINILLLRAALVFHVNQKPVPNIRNKKEVKQHNEMR